MKRILVASVAILMLAGCSSTPATPQGGTTFHPTTDEGSAPPPPAPPQQSFPAPAPHADPSRPQAMSDDTCGAADLQYLVGKPRTEIPVPLDPGKRRVVCSSCIITQDYRPDRQTITFDTDTGIIKSVSCG